MNLNDLQQHADRLRTPTFAARRLGVTPQTVYRWMRKGIIRYSEVGPFKKKRIADSEIARQRVEHVA
jgi:excisionase family DNA binding protein